MAIIFHKQSKCFHLYNNEVSYIMRIMENGQLENLYYGKKIHDKEDFAYFHDEAMRSQMSVCIPEPGQIDNETLSDLDVEWSDDACACVIMASGGYPKSYPKGIEITGLSNGQLDGVTVYHAGTKLQDNKLVTSGGRVLGVTALGDTLENALKKSYDAVEKIHFEGAHYRRDIGKRALEANK